jgi:hypothetical protein
LENGNPLLAIVSNGLLQWDYKASHPWVAVINFKYDGSKKNGMPGNDDYQLLNEIEETMLAGLKDVDGYLNIGRQTADGEKAVYFACRDFRKPSKVFYDTQQKNAKRFKISYEIYKDKYWQSFERFIPQPE